MADKAQNEVEKATNQAPASEAETELAGKHEEAVANGAAPTPANAGEKETAEKPSEPVKEEIKDKTDDPASASTDAPKDKDAEDKGEEKPKDDVTPASDEKNTENKGEEKPKDDVTSAADEKKDEDKGGEKPKNDVTPATEEKKTEGATEEAPKEDLPPYLAKNKALRDLFKNLPSIIEKTGHSEMWGVNLKDANHAPTGIIMMKFLRGNEGDAKAAGEQLSKSLAWRKEVGPLALAEAATFPASKFKDLGYVTTYNGNNGHPVVVTWNIYGAVKNIATTFSDVDEFIKWRVALMELAIRELKLDKATTVFDYDGEDPYQMIQVHDYLNIRFLFMDPAIRKASRTTIEVFSMAYPELLQSKFFVNVPSVMGWVYSALKMFLSKNTVRKFHPIANGAYLARELDDFGKKIPEAYGGGGSDLAAQGRTVALKVESKAPSENTAEKKDTKKDEEVAKENEPTKPAEEGKSAETATESAPATATEEVKGKEPAASTAN